MFFKGLVSLTRSYKKRQRATLSSYVETMPRSFRLMTLQAIKGNRTRNKYSQLVVSND